MSKKSLAFLALILVSVLWATAGLSAKTLVKEVDPFVVGFWRFFLASLFITPFFLREKRPQGICQHLFLPNLIGALNVPFYYLGIRETTANAATLIYTAGPLTTAILSYFLIRERNTLSRWIGILLGIIGVLIIIFLPMMEQGKLMAGNLQGNLLLAAGMFSWTIYAIWSRHFRMDNRFSPTVMTSVYFYFCSFVCLCLVLIFHQSLIPVQFTSLSYILVLLYSAIFITLITYFLFQWTIEHLSATTVSFKQYIETVFAVIFNTIFLGETMTSGFVAGTALVFVGLFVATIGKMTSLKGRR